MEFGSPLWLLAIPILLLVGMGYLLHGTYSSNAVTLRLSHIEPSKSSLPRRRSRWWVVPVLLIMVGAMLGAVGAANPLQKLRQSDNRSTVMLVLDVSKSMLADDVSPNRLVAAQTVLREVVQTAPPDLNIGLVTFADNALLQVPPTQNRELLLNKLDAIVPRPDGTRTGEGVMTAIAAIDSFAESGEGTPIEGQLYVISDGAETPPIQGIRSLSEATNATLAGGYRINTVAYGTLTGTYNGVPQPPDFPSLETAADATGGIAVKAPTAAALAQALETVPQAISYHEVMVTNGGLVSLFNRIGLVLIVLGLFAAAWKGVVLE
jgi:Ca-activated chloride channel family protein